MANQFFVPFNYEPVATVQTAASYTVPAGKYAIAKVTLSAAAYLNDEASLTSPADGFSVSGGNESISIDIVLNAGDVLSKTETPANKTVTYAGTSMTTAFGKTFASISVDTGSGASTVAFVEAVCSVMISNSTGTSDTIDIDGSANVAWHIQEYTIIS